MGPVVIQNLRILHKWNFAPFDQYLHIASSPQPLKISVLFSASMCLMSKFFYFGLSFELVFTNHANIIPFKCAWTS